MYALTAQQENIWNLQRYYEESGISNISGILSFEEKLDLNMFEKALNAFIKNNTGMRLQFQEKGKEVYQYVAEYQYEEIPVLKFAKMQDAREYFEKESKKPFSMTDTKMYRFCMFESEERNGVYTCFNHLVSDAWTLSLFCREAMQNYYQLSQGEQISEKEASYVDYIQKEKEYKASARYLKDEVYWKERFGIKPKLSFVKPNAAESKTVDAARMVKVLDEEMAKKVKEICVAYQISPAVLYEAVVFTYLYKLNETEEVFIGMPVLNRANKKEKMATGMFISTMPLGIRIEKEDTLESLCHKITQEHFETFRHQKYPYGDILKAIREKYAFTEKLYDVIVSYQNAKVEYQEIPYFSEWLHNGCNDVPLAIHIDDREDSGSFTITLDYQTEVFSETEMGWLYERLQFILTQLYDEKCKVGEISILPLAEYHMLVQEFNSTEEYYPKTQCVHELFQEIAGNMPDKTALIFKETEITYGQLDAMSNALAHILRDNGVKSNAIVPIISKRSWHTIVAMLAVLKAGGAYMPVDPTYPADRVAYMLDEAKAELALVYGYSEEIGIKTLDLETVDYTSNAKALENQNVPKDTCYVIFTSGSTGKPKGTLISHGNLMNLVYPKMKLADCHMNGCERVLAITALTFDVMNLDIVMSLMYGKTLVLASDEDANHAEHLAHIIKVKKIEYLWGTPTKLKHFFSNKKFCEAAVGLKQIGTGGEVVSSDLCAAIKEYTDSDILNVYGPTETTVFSSYIKVADQNDITIGKPIQNTQIYILDSKGQICPIGIVGELCIAGDGVGKGYLNRLELTAEKFVDNPFYPGTKMYKTGDYACYRADGEIAYFGRMDTQVKVRGLRIELGEIESRMGEYEGIQMSVVADKRDENNRQYLVGYYTAEKIIDEKQLRSFLAEKLPRYMVPNFFMQLEEIPITTSGKADRKNLPTPELTRQETVYVAPQNELQSTLCQILSELLKYEPIGIQDDFFEMGGDSLSAIAYVAEASAKGIEFDLQTVFEKATVAELSEFIAGKSQNKQNTVNYTQANFEGFREILAKNQKNEAVVPKYQSLGNILLTGVTGYLGAHILDKCMELEKGKIYCLIRSDSLENAKERCRLVCREYFADKYEAEIGKCIIPIPGDITKEHLADNLPEDIQTLIHAAATVKHYGVYDEVYRINAGGTKNMLEAAKRRNAMFLYISTVSVGGLQLTEKGTVPVSFDESCLYIGQNLDNVYIRSKFEAERMVLETGNEGLSTIIFRVGNLSNRYSDLKFQNNYTENAFLRRIKAFVDTRAYPMALAKMSFEFSPVDLTAEAIVKLAEHYADSFSVFHVDSTHKMPLEKIMEKLNGLQWIVKAEDTEEFLYRLSQKKGNAYDALGNELKELDRQSE